VITREDSVQLERERQAILAEVGIPGSKARLLVLIISFFRSLLKSDGAIIAESYLLEFLDQFIVLLHTGSVYALSYTFLGDLLVICDQLLAKEQFVTFHNRIRDVKKIAETEKEKICAALEGNNDNATGEKLVFPLVYEEEVPGLSGILDSLTISIIAGEGSHDTFSIVPSEIQIEQRISEQVRESWRYAT
jgi:hypothetical protein